MAQSNFDSIFTPRSIAVVGASNTEGSVGKAVMDNLLSGNYKGKIYPVNLKTVSFTGLSSFPSLSAITDRIDLAIIMVPAAAVPEVMQQAGRAGVKGVIVISSGFKESSEAGAELEKQIAHIAEKYDITLVGPNCLGVLNPHADLNASFAGAAAPKGSIAFISQSGALCTAILDMAEQYGIGFSKFISIGNKASLHELDILEYLAKDEQTKVIMLYSEGLTPSTEWVEKVRHITTRVHNPKPIIVLKAGRTADGTEAAKSHTGSLAGDDRVYKAFFRQAGVIQADSLDDLVTIAATCADNPLPPRSGLAIITNAGGPGIVATDRATLFKMSRTAFTAETMQALRKTLPLASSILNPVDILGDADADRFSKTLEIVLQDKNRASCLVIVTPQAMTDPALIAKQIVAVRKKYADVPLVVSLMGDQLMREAKTILRKAAITVVELPDQAVRALAGLEAWSYAVVSERIMAKHRHHIRSGEQTSSHTTNTHNLGYEEVHQLLHHYEVPAVRSHLVHNPAQAVSYAHELGKPVVLKIVSPDILHKTDIGGVALYVLPKDAGKAYNEIIANAKKHEPNARIEGVLVQQMVAMEQELLIGAKRDPVFGPVIVLGLGGIYVQVFQDVALRIAPLIASDVEDMRNELRAAPLIMGTRGQEGIDFEAVTELVLTVSKMMLEHPEIQELDLNPVIVGKVGKGARVVDAKMLVAD